MLQRLCLFYPSHKANNNKRSIITLRSEFRYALLRVNRTKFDSKSLFCHENKPEYSGTSTATEVLINVNQSSFVGPQI